ncbi:MAG TPA: hypothetical protein VFJ74_09965 [Gemmatimonadaceae bacterium]|nr:hypothetical protein [Gemmatimonadaceae bacterium]
MTATRVTPFPPLHAPPPPAAPPPRRRRGGGLFVVVVGPDGIGKTTVARALVARYDGPTGYFHFTPPIGHALDTRPPDDEMPIARHTEPRGSLVLGCLRLGRSIVRAWVGHACRVRPALDKGALVVADRWLYGYVGDPLPLRFFGPRGLGVLALRLLPEPDLVAVLWSDAQCVYERKQEMSLAEIERGIEAWAALPVAHKRLFDAREPASVIAQQILEALGR